MTPEVRRDREGRWVACVPVRADVYAPVHDVRRMLRIPVDKGATREQAERAARGMRQ